MAKFVSGCVVGALLTLLVLALFFGFGTEGTQRTLIESSQKIQPGMDSEAVVRELKHLGEPRLVVEPGAGFPEYARRSIPGGYHKSHGLLVFYVGGIGPKLLLVYLDAAGCVSFVSSVAT